MQPKNLTPLTPFPATRRNAWSPPGVKKGVKMVSEMVSMPIVALPLTARLGFTRSRTRCAVLKIGGIDEQIRRQHHATRQPCPIWSQRRLCWPRRAPGYRSKACPQTPPVHRIPRRDGYSGDRRSSARPPRRRTARRSTGRPLAPIIKACGSTSSASLTACLIATGARRDGLIGRPRLHRSSNPRAPWGRWLALVAALAAKQPVTHRVNAIEDAPADLDIGW